MSSSRITATVLDPACGSGGMFVQSAHFIERMQARPDRAGDLLRHGEEPDDHPARQDEPRGPRAGRATSRRPSRTTKTRTSWSARPTSSWPIRRSTSTRSMPTRSRTIRDCRSVCPGVNKQGKVSNGNYVWISYFDSYLNENGRAGFVMSSQASSAGGEEAQGAARARRDRRRGRDDRHPLATSSTRARCRASCGSSTRQSPKRIADKVLMLDARNVYRKVTRKIYDF